MSIAITAALGGQTDLQAAKNALAPYAVQVIGSQYGHGEDKNTAAQLASHAILGAALAYVNGGNPAAGGSAAVAAESAAIYLTNQYKDKKQYQDANGEFQPNLLPETVKTQIRDLTAGIGVVFGGTIGDSAFAVQLAGVVGQNAVENNEMGIFPVNPKRMESAQSLAEYGIKEGWSSDKLQKEVSKELRGRDPQGEAYVGAIVNGSVVIASVTPLGSSYRIYQGGKWVFYTTKQVAGSAALRNTVKSAMLNGTISGGISAASGDDVQGIIANTAFGAGAGSMSTWKKVYKR